MYRKKTRGWSQHLDFMLIDILSLEIAFFLGAGLSFGWNQLRVNFFAVILAVNIAVLNLAIMITSNAYEGVIRRNMFNEFLKTARSAIYVSSATLFFIGLIYTGQRENIYRMLMLSIILYFIICLSACELWKRYLRRRLQIKNHTGMLIIARMDRLRVVIPELQEHNYQEYRFVGVALSDKESDIDQANQILRELETERLGRLEGVTVREDLINYLSYHWVDEIYMDIPIGEDLPVDLINEIMDMGITVHSAIPRMEELQARHKNVEWICSKATITTSLGYVSGRDLFLKRIFDIFGGVVGCICMSVIFLFVAPVIYLTSPGPIFFKQRRVGENGRTFMMYKFRTMVPDAEQRKKEVARATGQADALMFKMEHDPRIIGQRQLPNGRWKRGIGGWMRDLSLDEFPQFINVLRGDMSLVGTRPPTVEEWMRYKPSYRVRMSTKPGITGLWQVSGRSQIRDFDQVVQLDREYIENWSLLLDFRILLKTVEVVIERKGAM